MTGLGRNPPLNPHDRRSGADNITPPWPGYLVGGPHPSPKDWVDSQNDYRTNEIAINWNGALIYALAGFLPGSEQVPVAEVKKKPGRQGAGCGSGRFVLSDTHAGVAGTGMCDLRGRLHTRRTTGRGSAGGVRLIVRMPDGQ